ncbi:MAG: glycosyltransferase family 4 protein [Rhodothermales bacterium]
MRRIGHYAPNLWASGGIATYVRRLGDAQVASGHDVVYFSASPAHRGEEKTVIVDSEAALYAQAEALGLDVLHLHKPVADPDAAPVPLVRTMHGNQGSCPTGSRYLVRSGAPCTRMYSPAGCFVSHLTERCGSLRPDKLKRHFGGIKRELYAGTRMHTFTVSGYLRDRMVATGFDPTRLHVLLSPAPDVDAPYVPTPADGVARFLFLGRLVDQKGAEWLLRAFARVRGPAHLDIGGDGPLQGRLEAFCRANGLSDRVTFHGWVKGGDVPALIQRSRAVVFPSVWQEPAGLVTLESAAYGRAVIASEVGGIPEYARDDFALRVPPNDVDRLAAAIERLIERHDEAETRGRAGYALARAQFSMRTFIDRLDALYDMALQAGELRTV